MSYPQTTFYQTTLSPGSLVARRRNAVARNTLKYQLEVLKKTGRYDAFRLEWHPSYSDEPLVWPIPNHLFWDSDIAKWIEGACYFLKNGCDPVVQGAVTELVDMIRSAQQPDGYINIHYTVVEPGRRFTNLRDFHELYNAGHLIEAALAHEDCFGDRDLLDPMLKYVELLISTFGKANGQLPGYPGHPEIEMALLRLYDRTGDRRHLELAEFFLKERGNPTGFEGRHFYDVEAERRGDDPNKRPAFYPEARCLWYHQAHVPIAEQDEVEGHAVRAMYLLTAAADLTRMSPGSSEKAFENAVYRLWDNMVGKKMYVTGGIGAMKQWEGFGRNYLLPQGTDEGGCYSETCAAIGCMMFAERLLQLRLDGTVADIMELCLYNAVLTSMSHDGKCFTYVNQLASSNEDPSRREDWFTCACCPPNMLRLLGQIGGYIWSHKHDKSTDTLDVVVHLYIPGTLSFDFAGEQVVLQQESNWPWDGRIDFKLTTNLRNLRIRLRIPSWAPSFELSNHDSKSCVTDGYLLLDNEWLSSNPCFTFTIPLQPRMVSPHPLTNQCTLTIIRGPIVYCVEDIDNPFAYDHFRTLQIKPDAAIEEYEVADETTGDEFVGLRVCDGASAIATEGRPRLPWAGCESRSQPIENLAFVPYYFRANRAGGSGQMRVGLKRAMG